MPPQTLTRPPGFADRAGREAAESAALVARLQAILTRFGYQMVETPFVEYADLFLTKSGDEAVNRLFTFELHGRQLCLRSEFTPSAARLYVERYQHEPKPIRWQFGGPVFRYEANQRQLTMLGAELIGAAGAGGEAEMIGMAAHGLGTLGLTGWKITVGHVGLLSQLLNTFGLDRRLQRSMLGQVENLRRPGRGRPYVEAELAGYYGTSAPTPEPIAGEGEGDSPETWARLGRGLQWLLESADLGTTGAGRTTEDIARRMLKKRFLAEQVDQAGAALDLLEKVTAVGGHPDTAFPQLAALLPNDATTRRLFDEFQAAVDLLPAYGVRPEQTHIQMGWARGLNYYTGIVFELYDATGEQVGGGGRYDDLLRVLGAAQDTPAVGFAYRLDRILAEMRRQDLISVAPPTPAALIVPVDAADDSEAARVAMALRQTAIVELYAPPTRSLSQVLARADKRGTPYVVIVGEAERRAGTLTVRDMRAGQQFSATLTELQAKIGEVNRE